LADVIQCKFVCLTDIIARLRPCVQPSGMELGGDMTSKDNDIPDVCKVELPQVHRRGWHQETLEQAFRKLK
jgi:hypothetical protein